MLLIGNVYIADFPNQRVRKVTISSGIITTIAGSGATGFGTGSYTGDGGQATSATLDNPLGVALDSLGIHSYIYLLRNYIYICFL